MASGGVLGVVGEVLGVMLAPKMAAKSRKYHKNGSKRLLVPDWLFDGFCVEDKQLETPKSVFEPRNPNVK